MGPMNPPTEAEFAIFPPDWKHVESSTVGPFVTRVVYNLPNGARDTRTTRRHRKMFGPLENNAAAADHATKWLLWRPRSLNWWIATLFMIGSFHFISGSVLTLGGYSRTYIIDLVFFTGSLFFTAAGYSQYYQALNAPRQLDSSGRAISTETRHYWGWQPRRIGFWATSPQFLGTLAFNVTTLAAFLDVKILGYDVLVWVPDYVGSILFLISGTVGVIEFCHRLVCLQPHRITWWIVMINFVGCVAFMISAVTAFVRPNPIFNNLATWATIYTLIGAVCFFVGAYLMWPELSSSEETA